MEVYEYLDQVEKQIRQEAVREEIRTELRQHIEDQADFYQESGMSRKEAVERAVEDMGDPVETGVQLDMVHQPQLDKKLMFAVALLLATEAILQIFFYLRIERQPAVFSTVAMIMFGLIDFLWMLMFATRSFFSHKFHEASTWFCMWLSIAILGAVFGGTGISGAERVGLTSPEVLQRMASMLITMFPAMYGGMVFGYREKKKGFLKLMVIFAADLLLGLLIGGGICMALLAPAHMALLTIGIKKSWYGEKGKQLLGRMWIFSGILSLTGILASVHQYGGRQLWKDNIHSYLETPDLPGILKALAGEYFPVSLCVCAAAILGFFLWLILDIRKLTNDLCRMLCLGVLGGFLIQTLYSLACLAGLGPYEYVFFPLLSVWYSGMGAVHWYHYWFLGIFLNCHKSDRIIPKKMK